MSGALNPRNYLLALAMWAIIIAAVLRVVGI